MLSEGLSQTDHGGVVSGDGLSCVGQCTLDFERLVETVFLHLHGGYVMLFEGYDLGVTQLVDDVFGTLPAKVKQNRQCSTDTVFSDLLEGGKFHLSLEADRLILRVAFFRLDDRTIGVTI